MSAVVTLQQAKKEGFNEVVYISKEGNILEGTTVNFWASKSTSNPLLISLVMDGKLYTCEEDILYGCTRTFVLQLASELGIEVVIGTIHKDKISSFQEAFITSTTREIHPGFYFYFPSLQVIKVVAMDSTVIGNGNPGPITRKLMVAFNDAKTLI